uniref:Uncharacterized protein n=1 Tax=Monopterus albus TaxID=43700 RepID=A0A3Q3J7C0_MONAL
MTPLAIIKSGVTGFYLDTPRAHIHDQVEKSVQQLYGKEVGPGLPVGVRSLQAAMTEQQQATGLCGTEVKRYGTCLLCVPPGQCQAQYFSLTNNGVDMTQQRSQGCAAGNMSTHP